MRWISGTDLLVNPDAESPDDRIIFRQIGWIGKTGTFYALHDHPMLRFEQGGFTSVYIQREG